MLQLATKQYHMKHQTSCNEIRMSMDDAKRLNDMEVVKTLVLFDN